MSVSDVFAMDQQGPDIFRGPAIPSEMSRTFGGQVASQALCAAQRTVEGLVANSLHGYFIAPGDSTKPIDFEVEHLRDGRSFATRQVRARQGGTTIFVMDTSFHRVDDEGPRHQDPMPQVPGPEEVIHLHRADPPSTRILMGEWNDWDIRLVPEADREPSRHEEREISGYRHIWFRNKGQLPKDLNFHQAALTYMSDMTLIYSSLIPHPGVKVQLASLDHAVWFHRPLSVNDWLLYVQHSPSAGNGVALTRGTVFDINGRLVATVMQEGLTRTYRENK